MPAEMKKSVEIPVKRYTGTVEGAKVVTSKNGKNETVEYMEFHVQTDAAQERWDGRFKVSVPNYLTNLSAYGRLLNRLGMAPKVGESFDEADLNGLEIAFDTEKNGNFTNVIVDSIILSE